MSLSSVQISSNQEDERPLKMSVDRFSCKSSSLEDAGGLKFEASEHRMSPVEVQSETEDDEADQMRPGIQSEMQQIARPLQLKQEIDVESLASSETSSLSPPPQPPAIYETQKKQTFLAAQLAEPNESTTFAEQLSAYQRQMDEAMEKLHREQQHMHAPPPGTASNQVQQGKSLIDSPMPQQGHTKGTKNQQQHEYNSQGGSGGGSGNIDYDEHVKHVDLFGVKIVALTINGKERLCLAQISNTLLKNFSYNEIHNRRVALGITCVQCTPIQLEMLRRAGAMPSSSRRCGMITMREAERLCRSFLAEEQPPELPENFYFNVGHRVNYGCKGRFIPSRYISSRAKCIECFHCGEFYSPNKFIFHSHKQPNATDCNPPDSPNINSWRKHINLDWTQEHSQEIKYAWEDVKSLFNGGTRRRTSSISANGAGGGSGAGGEGTALNSGEPGASPMAINSGEVASSHRKKSSGEQTGNSQLKLSTGRHLHSDQRKSLEGSSNRAGQQAAPMSQSERRKLPMSSWPRVCNQAPNLQSIGSAAIDQQQFAVKRSNSLMSHDQQAINQQQQFKKLASSHWLAPQHHAKQHLSVATGEHSNQSPSSYGSSSASDQHGGGTYPNAQSPLGVGALAHLGAQGPTKSRTIKQRQSPQQQMATQHPSGMISQQQQQRAQTLAYNPQDAGPAVPSTFIYGQLYSQLMQPHLSQQASLAHQQQQRQPQLSNIEAQLALRHHIWSSLLANIGSTCNPSMFEAANLHAPPKVATTTHQTQAYSLTNTPNQQQQHHLQMSSLLASNLSEAASGQQSSHHNLINDLSNQSPPSSASSFNPLHGLLPPSMRMYGAPAGQVGTNTNDLTTLFTSDTDSCK